MTSHTKTATNYHTDMVSSLEGGEFVQPWLKPWFLRFQGEIAHVTSAIESFPAQFKLEECVSTLVIQTIVLKRKAKSMSVLESAVWCDRARAIVCE